MGRPTLYTPELADKICEQLAQGISMRTVCKSDDMPSMSTVFKWLREIEAFSQQYARAKKESADAKLEDLDDIGDEAIQESKLADPKAASAVVNAYRLKSDNIKWYMSKLNAKKYGDKLDLDANVNAQVTIQTVNYADANNTDSTQV